jgi:hypothetical protein
VSRTPRIAHAVTLTLDGITYRYPEGPALYGYSVRFDPDGSILFHLGLVEDLTGYRSTAQPMELGPHTVQIDDNPPLEVRGHWWNASWRWPLEPPPIVKDANALVQARRAFPFGDTGCSTGEIVSPAYRAPMDTSDITLYMPTTGERKDIGLRTDNGGVFLKENNPAPLIAWGLAGYSCPIKLRDEHTGKPVNLAQYPDLNMWDAPNYQGAPWVPKGLPLDPNQPDSYSGFGGGWGVQRAHFCEMSGLAALATENDGVLENLQHEANWILFTDIGGTDPLLRPHCGVSEMRGSAWTLRQVTLAYIATKDREKRGPLPSFLLPSSYWQGILDRSLTFWMSRVNDPGEQYYRLLTMGRADTFAPWQANYVLTVLAYMVLIGLFEWQPVYLWCLKNAIDRASGHSGYPPGWGTAYYLRILPYKEGTTQPDFNAPYLTWEESFATLINQPEGGCSQEQYDALMADPHNGGVAMQGQEYNVNMRQVLVQAQYLDDHGICPVRAHYPELDACANTLESQTRAYGLMNMRASVVREPGVIPPIEPPTNGGSVTEATIAVGESLYLDLVTVPANGRWLSGPDYTSNDMAVAWQPDAGGVTVIGVAEGTAAMTLTGEGEGPVTAVCNITVTAPQEPLVQSATLVPRGIPRGGPNWGRGAARRGRGG